MSLTENVSNQNKSRTRKDANPSVSEIFYRAISNCITSNIVSQRIKASSAHKYGMDVQTVIIRLLLTFFLSLIFGLERQKSHKPVGFGTFIFVALGSCALGVISASHSIENSISLMGAVVTGIGFLGAGALIRSTDKVFGFTTAASVWIFAILGLAIGIGEYLISILIYILIWVIIIFDKYLERRGIGTYQRKISITGDVGKKDAIMDYLVQYTNKHKSLYVSINKESKEITLTYLVEGKGENIRKMIENLTDEKWVKRCELE